MQKAQVTVHYNRNKIRLNNFQFWLRWLVKFSRIFQTRVDGPALTHISGLVDNPG